MKELTHRPPQHKHAKTYDGDTGDIIITKSKYDEKQGYGGQQKKVSNINNNNTPRTI